MVDYTLGEACQAMGAICCGDLHVGFDLGGKGIRRHRLDAEGAIGGVQQHCRVRNNRVPWPILEVRVTNRPGIDKSLCSVFPHMSDTDQGWERNEKGYSGLKGRSVCFRPRGAPLAESWFVRRDRGVTRLSGWE